MRGQTRTCVGRSTTIHRSRNAPVWGPGEKMQTFFETDVFLLLSAVLAIVIRQSLRLRRCDR
jgi:hypothetical protein